MILYYVEGAWPSADFIENWHTWVRAGSPQEAFDDWIEFCDLRSFFCPEDVHNEPYPPVTWQQCVDFFDRGFGITLKKTYPADAKVEAGVIDWDDVHALTEEAL